jgi:hypothetical protein
MYDSVWAYAFILLVCAVLSVRIFFQNSIAHDSLSTLALANLVLCLLCFFAWGLTVSLLAVTLIAVIVFFINLRCICRYFGRLKHGGYSLGFMILSMAMLPCVAMGMVLVLYARPVQLPAAGFNVTKEKTAFSGSFRNGFTERSAIFEPFNAYVTTYTPHASIENLASENSLKNIPLVLFVPDVRASMADYEPFFLLLAQSGAEVKAAEFYTFDGHRFNSLFDVRPLRTFFALLYSLIRAEQFAANADTFDSITRQEYASLVELFGAEASSQGRALYLVSDANPRVLTQTHAQFSQLVTGAVSVIPGARRGLGCMEQTKPLLARYYGLSRDTTLFVPRAAVANFHEYIQGERSDAF